MESGIVVTAQEERNLTATFVILLDAKLNIRLRGKKHAYDHSIGANLRNSYHQLL